MEKLYSCRKCVLGIFLVLFVIFSADAAGSWSVSEPVYEGEGMVVEGNPFEITCRVTLFAQVKWQRDGVTLFPDANMKMSLEEDMSSKGTHLIAKLNVAHAHDIHTGEYRCSTFEGLGHNIIVLGANSIVGNFDFGTYKAVEYKMPLVLQCNFTIENSASDSFVLKWLKNNESVTVGTDKRVEMKPAENKLIVQRAVETDAGNYSCVVSNKKNNFTDLRLDFVVIIKPYVKLPQHTSVVEGEKLTISCNILGVPVPNIYWKVGNKTYQESEDRIKLIDNKEKGIAKATLQIDQATMDDRNTYTCVASLFDNRHFNATEYSTFVRVKDKLAALWPFLGICAEVVVLCTIILIYEKKRNKTELEESDTDGSPEQKMTKESEDD